VDENGNYVLPAVQDEEDGEDSSEGGEEEPVCDGVELTVTGEGEEGGFTATDADGNEVNLTVEDEDTAGDLLSAVNDLEADWALTEDGTVDDVGDDIAAYHDDGTGFGVLVKLYSIAAESLESCQTVDDSGEDTAGEDTGGEGEDTGSEDEGEEEAACEPVTVEELMAQLADGDSLADLFEEYGRPSMMGVGHIRQALNGDGSGGDGSKGVCNARANGGNANANGQNITCPTDGSDDSGKNKDDD